MPPGNYFSAEVEGEARRVKVSKVDRIRYTCSSFLIDHGKHMEIPWESLVPLQQEFFSADLPRPAHPRVARAQVAASAQVSAEGVGVLPVFMVHL